MLRRMRRALRSEAGQTMTEFALLAAGMLVGGAGLMKFAPDALNGLQTTFLVNRTPETTRPAIAGLVVFGTEEGTRTPTAYGHYHLKVACLPIPPPRQNRLLRVTRCLLLFRSRRHVSRIINRLLLFEDWHIFYGRRSLLHFQCRRIRQTRLSQRISLFFSKEA